MLSGLNTRTRQAISKSRGLPIKLAIAESGRIYLYGYGICVRAGTLRQPVYAHCHGRALWPPGILLEVRRTLLHECASALVAFLGHVEQHGSITGQHL